MVRSTNLAKSVADTRYVSSFSPGKPISGNSSGSLVLHAHLAAPLLTFGELIRDARKQAQRTGRKTAGALSVSHVYLSEVELGTRCALAPEHWPALVAFLPSLTLKKLKAHADLDRVLRIARRAAEEVSDEATT